MGLFMLLVALVGVAVWAEPVTSVIVTPDNTVYPPVYALESITVAGYTVSVEQLATGASEITEGTPQGTLGTPPDAADDFDLNNLVARNNLTGADADWKITMIGGSETFRDSNGDNPDFFIFEVGGNDPVDVRAIMSGGIVGQAIHFAEDAWGDTGLDRTGNPNPGQAIMGLAFAVTDLLDDAGNALTNEDTIQGIQVTSGKLDPSCFCAVVLGDGPANDPPIVDAGEAQTILWPFEKSVQLNGTATDDDPDGVGLLTTEWSKVSGPAGEVVFDDETATVTTATFPAPGVYELILRAWDEVPQESADTVTITVSEPVCPVGDMNADCKITLDDLLVLADYWLSSTGQINLVGEADINMADLAVFASAWRTDWTGSLKVRLFPQPAVDQGAQWRVDNGPWQDSSFEHNDLVPGTHTVRFKDINDWITPQARIVQIAKNQRLTINETYKDIPDVHLLISEFMASNISKRADGAGEYDDWIEILNFGATEIDIGGMYLTNDLDRPAKWRVPDNVPARTTIAAGGYLLIWADAETDEGPLHAAFNLNAQNGRIGLFNIDGTSEIDSLTYGRQVTDVSCGRTSQSDAQLRYFHVATPEAPNSSAYDGMVADTKFNPDRGFYDTDIQIEISCATEGATIKYTLDGSKPASSNGFVYVPGNPIAVAKGSPGVYDRATTTLRALAYKSGWLPTNVDTHTYIFPEDVIRQPKNIPGYPNPNTWLGGSGYNIHDYEMDPAVVNNPAYSGMIIDALKDIPTMSIAADPDDMNMSANGGFYWGSAEKPASVELIYPAEPGKNVQADCAIQPHSHNRMKRSLRLSFKVEYGQRVFTSSLLQDAPLNSENADRTLDRIVLRGGNNRSWARKWNPEKTTYTMDQWYRDKQIEMSGVGVRGTFVHLYINGLYWGLYNPVERPDAWFASSYLGGEKEDWYSVSHGGSHGGSATRWNYLKGTLKNKNMTVGANYAEMKEYLDIDKYIDYVMLCWYIGMSDWPGNNWWGGNRNNPPGPFMYFCWDGEWSWETTRGHNNGWVHSDFRSNKSGGATTAAIWHSLRVNDDFMMLFADRAYKHLFNDGALTNENSIASYLTLNDFVRDAVVGESARWGDTCDSIGHPTRTRDVDFVFAENETTGPGFMADNVQKFVNNLRNEGYYPDIDPPVLSRQGGPVNADYKLTMTNPNSSGTIYYTLDGIDPRQTGGAALGTLYSGRITLTKSVVVEARVLSGSTWSALNETTFAVGPVVQSLRITEMMYHPVDPPDGSSYTDEDFEFIELKNVGAASVNLNLVRFSNGIDFTFGDTPLAENAYVIVVSNQAAFLSRYDTFAGTIAGEYTGRLDNGGERIELLDAAGGLIQNFRYNDNWYDITDSGGFSLAIKDPTGNDPNAWDSKSGWRPSAEIDGSPGADDPDTVPELGSIVINEVLAHSHALDPDWIELHNTTTDQAINIGGWFLSDSGNDLKKYEILTDTIINPGGYAVFYENLHFGQFAPDPGRHTPFALSENGETIYLTSGKDGVLTGYTDEEDFGASETNVSFGRYQKSTGTFNFVAMSEKTPNAGNAYPKVGPIVISEIMYHPAVGGTFDKEEYEYIELYNTTDSAVPLYEYDTDAGSDIPWKFTDGIEYTFPLGTEIAPYGYLLVVKNPAAFAERHGSPAGVDVLGPYDKKLNNDGEKLELAMPGDTDVEGRYYIRIDRIVYNDAGGWPITPDGTGDSLTRINKTAYGNDVINWQAADPTPGR